MDTLQYTNSPFHLLLYYLSWHGGQHSVHKPQSLHVKVQHILTWTIRPQGMEMLLYPSLF